MFLQAYKAKATFIDLSTGILSNTPTNLAGEGFTWNSDSFHVKQVAGNRLMPAHCFYRVSGHCSVFFVLLTVFVRDRFYNVVFNR